MLVKVVGDSVLVFMTFGGSSKPNGSVFLISLESLEKVSGLKSLLELSGLDFFHLSPLVRFVEEVFQLYKNKRLADHKKITKKSIFIILLYFHIQTCRCHLVMKLSLIKCLQQCECI